jgi:hypothetical protein
MKATALALALIVALLLSVVTGIGLTRLVRANPIDWTQVPRLPKITIKSDGSIDPSSVPISRTEKVYTLRDNIINYSLDILCNDITVDGAGFTFQVSSSWNGTGSQITLDSNGVTVKNVNMHPYSGGIRVSGCQNTITKNTLPKSEITLLGNNNSALSNTLSYISLYGNYNVVTGNSLTGSGIFMDVLTSNAVIGNTIKDCLDYAVDLLSNGSNYIYLNNFVNNTKGNISPYGMSSVQRKMTWVYVNNTVFDNQTVGNYWSDYNGTDANLDGIGDTPYVIGGVLTDRYPLMVPVDISSVNVDIPKWTYAPSSSYPEPSLQSEPTPSNSPTTPSQEPTGTSDLQKEPESFPTKLVIAASVGSAASIVGLTLLVYFKKHRR